VVETPSLRAGFPQRGGGGVETDLSQKALVFGEQTPAVLHRHVQRPPVELHEGNAELEPERRKVLGSINRRWRENATAIPLPRLPAAAASLTSDRTPG